MVTSLDSIKEETYVTILFADVVGSTHLYELLGDEDARATVQQCVTIMKDSTEQYGGSVIKTMGDEVMSIFPSADNAMNAASKMQQRITNNYSLAPESTHVSIRIGSHYGSVIFENRDIFGAAVHTANRMTSQAKAGQIITTAVTVEQFSGEWRALARQIDIAMVRGQSDEVAMFEVLWQPEEATSMLPSIMMEASPDTAPGKLCLRVGSEEVVMGEDGLVVATLGRADENNVVVKGQLISRVHACIECNKNRFMLIDKSTNGTFVQREDGEEFYIRRDSMQLFGSGIIGLGKMAAPGSVFAIAYEIL